MVKSVFRSYESALKECTEYRQLKTEMLKKEFKQCSKYLVNKKLLKTINELVLQIIKAILKICWYCKTNYVTINDS